MVLTLLGCSIVGCGRESREPGIATGEKPVPVYQEPHHHLVYQNSQVRVLDVRIAPGESVFYHTHSNRVAGVTIEDARSQFQLLGRAPDPVAIPDPFPNAFDNQSDTLPLTHRGVNVDTVPIHYLVGEWLASSGVNCAPLPAESTRRLVDSIPTALIYEIRLPPHGASRPHTHACPGLTVIATAGALDDSGGVPTAAGGSGRGRWYWRAGSYRHTVRNDSKETAIYYELDWR